MIRINCPFCGWRNHEEFTPNGSANARRPRFESLTNDAKNTEIWYESIFVRQNPRGMHREYWHHTLGCKSWLILERDTVNHHVKSVKLASPHSNMILMREGVG